MIPITCVVLHNFLCSIDDDDEFVQIYLVLTMKMRTKMQTRGTRMMVEMDSIMNQPHKIGTEWVDLRIFW